jgi:hypothetical protein
VTAFLLGSSAVPAVSVLFESQPEGIENAAEFREAAERILGSRKDGAARQKPGESVIDRARAWEDINRAVHEAIDDEAGKLREAQRLLVFAVIAALLTIIVSIFCLADA